VRASIAIAIAIAIASGGCGRIGFDSTTPGSDAASSDGTRASWSLVQATGSLAQPTVDIAPAGTGNLIVVAIQANLGALAVDDGGDTFVHVLGADSTSGSNEIQIWYAANAVGGATVITLTVGSVNAIVAWEFSGVSSATSVDDATGVNTQNSATPQTGPVTTTAPGDVVIAAAIDTSAIVGIQAGSPFTNDLLTNSNGWAHLTSAVAPAGGYQAIWNADVADFYCSSAVAFLVR
jgi:hypothetical protein